jgi:Acyl-protein synthetase, LuxE
MSARAESDSLHARVRAIVLAYERRAPAPEPFDAVAVDIARFQAVHVPGYSRLCAAHGIAPGEVRSAAEVPAVPTEAFKLGHVFAFDPGEARVAFRTSGTTLGARGVHRMRTTATYDAAALAFGRAMLVADLELPVAVVVIGPPPEEAMDSSLTHMCTLFARSFGGATAGRGTFFVRDGVIDLAGLRSRIAGLPRSAPAIVLATSFALVHLIDALGSEPLALPRGSQVMQTGGYKGRSRAVAADELRRAVARTFAIEEDAVVSEYGMTELSSQFWEGCLVARGAPRGVYLEPPWARVVPVDPQTLVPTPQGHEGIARIEDLGNVDSAFAVLTQDRVRRAPVGFELVGRQPGASPRGCSIGLDEMLSMQGRR